ncbi:HlyD family type I secretion periplasmic adaptor subunit [Pseudotabrizicola formosa]|uniref:HlyD family type I secretion periplasmic adaptor subunit n=1 Tax=Pseudotabrizicola formosa TaxID=2030009 RepID=UPI000CD177A9|nr:HlyD family type I secretion periplasmic adaptor subunit [Pseudotabrizicola formosa]
MTAMAPSALSAAAPGFGPVTQTAPLIRAGALGLALLVGGLGVTSALIPIDGAVIASGQLMVQGKAQPVQSLDPGIVTRVAVRNGDHVAAGAVLLSLDPTVAQARLDIARDQLANALAEEARLMAEANGLDAPDFTSPALPFDAPDLTRAIARQQAMFTARKAQRAEAVARLAETDAQLTAQMAGIAAQTTAAQEESRLLQTERERMATLVAQGLARQSPLSDILRQEAALTGRLAGLKAEAAGLEAARRDAVLALNQQDRQTAAEVAEGLRDSGARIAERTAEILSLTEALQRSDLRAPVAGVVHELAVTAPGAVIAAGATVMQIVPADRGMEIEVAVDPRSIETVHPGQSAEIMLGLTNARALPRLPAHVTHVPPGAITDEATGRSFYRVTLTLDDTALPQDLQLVPGMPVEAFLATGERPLLSWLLAPLLRPMAHALRED